MAQLNEVVFMNDLDWGKKKRTAGLSPGNDNNTQK
jgi:hypothetical protein